MKKKTNKFIALIVTAACVVTCMLAPAQPAYGAGAEDDQNTKSDKIASEIADQFADPSNDPFDYTRRLEKWKALWDARDLPESFDLRNVDGKSYVTPVKLQHPFGSCWGFAAIAAAETSILGDPENLTSLTADNMDLSNKDNHTRHQYRECENRQQITESDGR